MSAGIGLTLAASLLLVFAAAPRLMVESAADSSHSKR